MASRRTARILLVLGVILILAGIGAVVYGSTPSSLNETDRIPAGWQYFNQFQWGILAGGTVQGTWQSVNNSPVQVFVYSDADYNAFVNGANLTGLFNVTAASGTISLSVPGFGTYHVVIQHAAGYEDVDQNVTVVLTTTGSDPTFTIGGIAAAVVGGAFLAYAVKRRRAREAPAGTLPSRATIQAPPPGPDTSAGGAGMYRIPPPLPGDPGNPPQLPGTGTPPTVSYPSGISPVPASEPASSPVGTVVVTVENHSAAEVALDLVVNGAPVTSMTVPAGGSRQVSVSAKLSSPFGSTVTVEAVLAGGHPARQAVFVGARGTAPVTLRIG